MYPRQNVMTILYLSIEPVLYKIDAPFAERTISEIVFLNLVSKSVINLGAVTLSLHIYMCCVHMYQDFKWIIMKQGVIIILRAGKEETILDG